MLNIIDEGTNWGWLCIDTDNVVQFEDGRHEPLLTSHLELSFWEKYKGRRLDEVGDIKDLKWLLSVAIEKKDIFAKEMFERRLLELE